MATFIKVSTLEDVFYINVDNIQAIRPIETEHPWDNERTAIYMNGGLMTLFTFKKIRRKSLDR